MIHDLINIRKTLQLRLFNTCKFTSCGGDKKTLPYRRAAGSLERQLHFCCKERAIQSPAAWGWVLTLDLLDSSAECQPWAAASPVAVMVDGSRYTLLSPWYMLPMAIWCVGVWGGGLAKYLSLEQMVSPQTDSSREKQGIKEVCQLVACSLIWYLSPLPLR